MRVPLLALLAGVLALACSDPPPAPPPPAVRERPLVRDGTVAQDAVAMPDAARVRLDLSTVRSALKAAKGIEGTWPASLGELQLYGLGYPEDLVYDPATGTVRSQAYPGL
jgi:hypothetical protein